MTEEDYDRGRLRSRKRQPTTSPGDFSFFVECVRIDLFNNNNNNKKMQAVVIVEGGHTKHC